VQNEFMSSMDAALGRDAEVAFQYLSVLNGVAVEASAEEAAELAALARGGLGSAGHQPGAGDPRQPRPDRLRGVLERRDRPGSRDPG
jgi:hypothetical protein